MNGIRETRYDDFAVHEFGAPAPDIPYVRNYFKSERLTRSLTGFLRGVLARERVDIVHGQHVMTALAAIAAARETGAASVVTVRDYWPVCYWSDLLISADGLTLCPECSAANMTRCVVPHAGAFWPAAVPMIPYMRSNLARKREGLARADAIVAVSHKIAADLRERAPELHSTRMVVIPNPVDVKALRGLADTRPAGAPPGPYAVYLGKLARNKGTDFLIDIVRESQLDWPLVIAGDGPGRAALEEQVANARANVRFTGWVDRDEAVQLLAHAAMLIFPSRGPESLSRVLIEASALGTPIAAMDTGGTRDIVEHDVTGLLSATPAQLAADVKRLRGDDALRARLGAAARSRIERDFESATVVARIEQVYVEVAKAARTGATKPADKQ
jgi:glycosyltransferase involved in cell wall biosynthesis